MKEVGNAAKETDLTFKYKAKDPKKKIEKDSLPFQVIIRKRMLLHYQNMGESFQDYS